MMATTALIGISESADAEAFDSSWWFEPFGLDQPTVAKTILPTAVAKGDIAVGCAANRTMIPFTLPADEPKGILITYPGARCGLAALVIDQGGKKALTAAWPFTTDGVEHEVRIERVMMAPDRLQAVIEGTIDDMLPLTWLDVLFPVDRAFYAEGSVHSVVLAGIAHRFSIGAMPHVRITPDAPSYAALRDEIPMAVDDDGAITIRTEGMAAIFPVKDAAPTLYSIQGPVTRIEKYTGQLFGRDVWDVRVTVARIGDENDKAVDLSVLVSDIVLDGGPLPQIGDDISTTIRLQGRIWWPNVKFGT